MGVPDEDQRRMDMRALGLKQIGTELASVEGERRGAKDFLYHVTWRVREMLNDNMSRALCIERARKTRSLRMTLERFPPTLELVSRDVWEGEGKWDYNWFLVDEIGRRVCNKTLSYRVNRNNPSLFSTLHRFIFWRAFFFFSGCLVKKGDGHWWEKLDAFAAHSWSLELFLEG